MDALALGQGLAAGFQLQPILIHSHNKSKTERASLHTARWKSLDFSFPRAHSETLCKLRGWKRVLGGQHNGKSTGSAVRRPGIELDRTITFCTAPGVGGSWGGDVILASGSLGFTKSIRRMGFLPAWGVS